MFLTELRSVETISASVSPANSTDSRTSFEYHPQSPTISLASKQNFLLSDTRSADFFGIKIAYAVYNHFYICFSYPALWTGHQQQRSYQPMFYWNVYKQQSPHARGFPHT